MKKLLSSAYLWAIILLLAIPLVHSGCKTSPAQAAYRTDVASVTTANSALIAFKQWLSVKESDLIARKHAGENIANDVALLDAKWEQGAKLWDKYTAAQAVAFSVTRTLITTTNTATGIDLALKAMQDAEFEFVQFVTALKR